MGKPVVAYDIRGVREVVDPETGLLARRGDRRALTAIVDGLLGDPGRCAALGVRCRDRVVERFSEDDVIDRLRITYESMQKDHA